MDDTENPRKKRARTANTSKTNDDIGNNVNEQTLSDVLKELERTQEELKRKDTEITHLHCTLRNCQAMLDNSQVMLDNSQTVTVANKSEISKLAASLEDEKARADLYFGYYRQEIEKKMALSRQCTQDTDAMRKAVNGLQKEQDKERTEKHEAVRELTTLRAALGGLASGKSMKDAATEAGRAGAIEVEE